MPRRRVSGLSFSGGRTRTAVDRDREAARREFLPAALEDAVLLVDRGEELAVLADALGGPQEEVAARLERVVERRDDLFLELAAEIDQEVAAGDQVHPRKRRIADDAVRREHANVAHRLLDDPACAVLGEEALSALRAHAPQELFGIAAGARDARARARRCRWRRSGARGGAGARRCRSRMQDAEGIDLFAGGAAGHPHPDRLVGAAALQEAGDHVVLQHLEGVGVPEEVGDVDQEVAEERHDLAGSSRRRST